MTNYFKFLLGLAMIMVGSQAHALLVTGLSEADCNLDPTCYYGPSGPPADNPDADDVSALVGVDDLVELYKQDVGGSESGDFASEYETSFFNSALDPEDALIEYVGSSSISCPECFLLVKDGAADPNWYVFDIGTWNGMEDIIMEDFWLDRGAISHVSIYSAATAVPTPGTAALLAIGVAGFAATRRKTC